MTIAVVRVQVPPRVQNPPFMEGFFMDFFKTIVKKFPNAYFHLALIDAAMNFNQANEL